ncbi:MAG TPA: DUF1080 domain-containing protein [Gemmatirosa sp.]
MTSRFAVALAATLVSAAPLAAQLAAAPPHASSAGSPNARVAARGGWTVLFDGTPASLDAHWRGYRRTDVPTDWKVQEGVLTLAPGGDSVAHGDLVSREQYGDFDLEYEWKISPGGNSGLIYRVAETEPTTWQTGAEMQVLDDARHADGKLPSHRAGALYDLVAPPPGVARPVGEFNRGRIVMRGMHVQQYLNGKLTADLDFASPRGQQLVAASKFHVYPHFMTQRSGYIALQDHGDAVTFRSIRIRRLDAGRDSTGAVPGA